jgi:ATP-dependent DNA ligase
MLTAFGKQPSTRSAKSAFLEEAYKRVYKNKHSEGDGREMFKAVCKLGLEGIVSKKLDAPYKSGQSKAWLKSKIRTHRLLHA